MQEYLYPLALLLISLAVLLGERLFGHRDQRLLRPGFLTDLTHLVFNGHFLGVILYGLAGRYVLPYFDALLIRLGLSALFDHGVARDWPLWLQIPMALLAIDLLQWSVHLLLHRVPWLWRLHQVHHSVVDGEMDWIVSFRFQWLEVAFYRALLYLPLAVLGFAAEAVMVHAVFGTLVGHLNHSNLDLGHGRWRYLLNSPRMHLWHHAHDEGRTDFRTHNFAIIFSLWDWLFGTAHLPDHPPARLGFSGVERVPRSFLAQAVWPLSGWLPRNRAGQALAMLLGAGLLLLGWRLAQTGPAQPYDTQPPHGAEHSVPTPDDSAPRTG